MKTTHTAQVVATGHNLSVWTHGEFVATVKCTPNCKQEIIDYLDRHNLRVSPENATTFPWLRDAGVVELAYYQVIKSQWNDAKAQGIAITQDGRKVDVYQAHCPGTGVTRMMAEGVETTDWEWADGFC